MEVQFPCSSVQWDALSTSLSLQFPCSSVLWDALSASLSLSRAGFSGMILVGYLNFTHLNILTWVMFPSMTHTTYSRYSIYSNPYCIFLCPIANLTIHSFLFMLSKTVNMLHGPFLESFQNMTSIESLYLSRNNFNFIPLGETYPSWPF